MWHSGAIKEKAELIELLNDFLAEDIALPMFTSLFAGLLIGLEREVRGKPAGLRTHMLVCFSATLLTLAAARQAEWTMELHPGTQLVTDPARMAHGILTGIGFLGAGVIFREGASVQGLTTAASLWITAALGVVFGIGMYWLAVAGTGVTILVLTALRLVDALLPSARMMRLNVTADAQGDIGAQGLRDLLRGAGIAHTEPFSQSHQRRNGTTLFTTVIWCRHAAQVEEIGAKLASIDGVLSYSLLAAGDEPAPHPEPHAAPR